MLSVHPAAFVLAILGFAGLAITAAAQDLEPRSYSASPIGTRFVGVGASRSTGDVLVDPSLPIEDVQATVNSAAIGAGATFVFFGRTALGAATFPYVWAEATGKVNEAPGRATRSGLGDPRLRLSVNLVGGRPLTVREFATARRPTIVGVSLTVVPPLGQYDPQKLINLGSNRWSFKPEAGFSKPVGKWIIDGYAGLWLFTANDTFYPGSSVRTQQPVFALQGHASYTVKPRLWVAFDGTWYAGGTTSVDGTAAGDLQRNSRVGATLSLPLMQLQSLKITYNTGATTRFGADFTTVGVAWQLSWFD